MQCLPDLGEWLQAPWPVGSAISLMQLLCRPRVHPNTVADSWMLDLPGLAVVRYHVYTDGSFLEGVPAWGFVVLAEHTNGELTFCDAHAGKVTVDQQPWSFLASQHDLLHVMHGALDDFCGAASDGSNPPECCAVLILGGSIWSVGLLVCWSLVAGSAR